MSTQAEPAARKRVGLPTRVLGAVALGAIGFGLIVAATAWRGCGHDVHILRVAATFGVLLLAALVVLWPRRSMVTRLAAATAGIVIGPVAWWVVPCQLAGQSLLTATVEREGLSIWMGKLLPEDVWPFPEIRVRIDELNADYPTLSNGLRAQLDAKQEEAVHARVTELRELSASDPAGFVNTAPSRRALVQAFPEAKPRLIAAEEQWATRWARFTAVAYTEGDISPAFVRKGCSDSEQVLLTLPTLDDSPARLLEARRVFFHAAHETAEKEIVALHEGQQFDRAFNVAFNHELTWGKSADLVTPENRKELEALRVRCQSLRENGDATAVETAPEPRPRK